jgi:single-strand DNA-binding protein
MSSYVNKVILLGNVGQDPKQRVTPNGATIVELSLATTEKFKGKDGSSNEETTWHNLVSFGKTAQIIGEYVKKGTKMYIEGRIRVESWVDHKSGDKKSATKIVVDQFVICGSTADSKNEKTSQAKTQKKTLSEEFEDEDPPF